MRAGDAIVRNAAISPTFSDVKIVEIMKVPSIVMQRKKTSITRLENIGANEIARYDEMVVGQSGRESMKFKSPILLDSR